MNNNTWKSYKGNKKQHKLTTTNSGEVTRETTSNINKTHQKNTTDKSLTRRDNKIWHGRSGDKKGHSDAAGSEVVMRIVQLKLRCFDAWVVGEGYV